MPYDLALMVVNVANIRLKQVNHSLNLADLLVKLPDHMADLADIEILFGKLSKDEAVDNVFCFW